MLLFYRIFSNQKHSTRKCITFIGVEYLVRIVNSRGERKLFDLFGHRIKEMSTNVKEMLRFW